jgi:HAD superfamily hydrolase (TIGR01484 family)
MPTPWQGSSTAQLKTIRGVCLDIDDTLSTHGKLTAEAYAALWALKEAGFAVVPITGRPAGWCDHFARFWPVSAIVGENGAFSFYMTTVEGAPSRRDRLDTPGAITAPDERRARLDGLWRKILARFPQAKLASDQAYREHDLAIDFCEDVPAWPRADIDALVEFCQAEGAHAKVSSIHVNAWFGEFDKRRGFAHLLAHAPASLALPGLEDEWIFIGDSPNDEPLFKAFRHSVGVANVTAFLDRMTAPPRWVTSGESGEGFVEFADKLIHSRSR